MRAAFLVALLLLLGCESSRKSDPTPIKNDQPARTEPPKPSKHHSSHEHPHGSHPHARHEHHHHPHPHPHLDGDNNHHHPF